MQHQSTTSGPVPGTPSVVGPSAGLASVPLFHAAWLFAAGVAVTNWLWLRPSLVLIALALLSGLSILAALRAPRIAWLPVAVLWLLLGAWCAGIEPHPAPAPALAALSNGLLRNVEGTILDAGPVKNEIEQNLPNEDPGQSTNAEPDQRPSQRIDLRLSTIEVITNTTDSQAPVSGNVRLTVRWPAPDTTQAAPQPFRCGDSIRAVARLLQPEIYRDPGVWSREDYLLSQGITSTATINIDRIEKISAASTLRDPQLLSCRIGALQHAASARILALPAAMRAFPKPLRLTPDDAIMLAAMVSGDRTYLTHSLRAGFERTGSFHMLVVSGFHLAIVAGCVLWLARRLRLPRVPATLLTILASFAYALFTGFATPVQRSLLMVTLYLLGRLLYRDRSALNTIGFASLCLLAVSPSSLFDGSFKMTLLAVVAIAGVAAPLLQSTVQPYLAATRDLPLIAIDNKLAPHLAQFRVILRLFASAIQRATGTRIAWRVFLGSIRFVLSLVELLVVSVVVELAMTLPMALYFHRITLLALPVNLCIFPLLLILMPVALVTLLALLIWPAAAVVPAALVALLLHIGVGLVHLFGSFAWGDARIPAPLLIQSAAFVLLLAASILFAQRALAQKDPHGAPPISRFLRNGWETAQLLISKIGRVLHPRQLAWLTLILAAVAVVSPRPIDHPHNALLVEAIDVGQGDSILLITPDGKTLLVDGGGHGGGPHQAPQDFDIGEEVVSEVLWSRGIRHLDAVALTHAHSDHMGGLPAVLRNFHPDQLWVGNNPRYGPYDELLTEAANLHVRVRALHAGDALTFGATQIAVLAPFANYHPGAAPGNNDSLVLHMAYEATSVMLEGDAESPTENAMLSESGLQSTLLKVGHHGSVSSTRPAFLARVAPQWAVISCGLRNRYGHPRPEVLQELQAAHIRTLSTDLNGAVTFYLDGKSIAPHSISGEFNP